MGNSALTPEDMNDKFRLYERSGVREYWILDPAAWSLWAKPSWERSARKTSSR